jgi:uncharacterized membrane protein
MTPTAAHTNWQTAPDKLFLVFATICGLVLLALIPPLAGGNETFNFQRVAGIAAFRPLIEPAEVPSGVARLLDAAHAQFSPQTTIPMHYTRAQFDMLAAIPLDRDTPAILKPNAIAVLNPVAYIPQVLVYWGGEALGLRPLTLFYLGRLAGLVAGIGLTYLAIRRLPYRQYALAALALLPTIVFSRSTLDADQVTNGLAFLFVASLLAETTISEPIDGRAIALLASLAFVVAQCKSVYMVLLFLAFALPVARFGSRRQWLLACLAIVVPGVLATLAWMASVKLTYFAGIHYTTWAGDVAPDEQLAAMLHDPMGYLAVVTRTLFASPLLAESLRGLIGVFGPPVTMPAIIYAALLVLLCGAVASEGAEGRPRPSMLLRALAIAAFVAGAGLTLTLLYIQWNGVGRPIVQGFQGRYLYPLLPGLFVLLPEKPVAIFGVQSSRWLAMLGFVSLASTLSLTYATYWA